MKPRLIKSANIDDLTKVSDKVLVQLILQHDQRALEEIIRRYKTKVKQLAFQITKSSEDAEDICQEVFLTVFLKLKDFQGKSAFSSWLYRIAFNASLMKLRKDKGRNANIALENLYQETQAKKYTPLEFQTETYHDLAELKELLSNSLDKLPAQYKAILILNDIENLTYEEIAEITKLTIPAIKSRLHRARLLLKRRLAKTLLVKPDMSQIKSAYC